MSFDLMFEILWKSTAISAVAVTIVWLVRGRSPAERAWAAHAGLLLTLLTPLLVLRGPDLEVVAPWSEQTAISYESAVDVLTDPVFDALSEAPVRVDPNLPFIAPEIIAFATYGVIALLLVLGLGVAVSRLFLLQHRAQVLTDPVWLSALAHAQRRMGFKQGAALLVSEDLGSPVSWGFFRPTILLNPNAVNTPAQAEAIISHELAHVMRLDWANLMIARLATSVFWFNPLVWVLARQAHQSREEAADDTVLRGPVAGTDYASLLVGIARHENRSALLAANGVAPGKDSLKRRLTRVLDAKARRSPTHPALIVFSSLAALSVVTPLAALTPVKEPLDTWPIVEVARPGPLWGSAVTTPPPAVEPEPQHPQTVVAASAALAQTSIAAAPASVDDDKAQTRNQRGPDDLLLRMSIHGVTPEWVEGLTQVNPKLRGITGDQLVALAVHRITPERLSQWEALGYGDLDYQTIISMAAHRVTPEFIRSMAEVGYANLSAEELIRLRVHRVSADYIRRMEAGGLHISPGTVAIPDPPGPMIPTPGSGRPPPLPSRPRAND